MKRTLVCLVLACCILFAGGISFAEPLDPSLNDAVNAFLSAYKNKDADSLSNVMAAQAAQYSFRVKTGKSDVMSRQELLTWLRNISADKYSIYDAANRSMEYVGGSKNIALVKADLSAAWKGAESKAKAGFLFTKVDGKWQLLSYSLDQWQDSY